MGSLCHVRCISISYDGDDERLMIISVSYSTSTLLRKSECEWVLWMRRRMKVMLMNMNWSHLPLPSVVVGLQDPTKAWRLVRFLVCKCNVGETSVMCDVSVSPMKAWWLSELLTPRPSCWEWVSVSEHCGWRGRIEVMMMSMDWSHLPFPSVIVRLHGPPKVWWFVHLRSRKPYVWKCSVVCGAFV